MKSAILTVTSKGQVTFRKEVLEHLGLRPGDRLVVEMQAPGRAEVRAAAGSFDAFFGSAEVPGTEPLSVEEMNAIAAKGWAGQP